jgi:hypothetical protein
METRHKKESSFVTLTSKPVGENLGNRSKSVKIIAPKVDIEVKNEKIDFEF